MLQTGSLEDEDLIIKFMWPNYTSNGLDHSLAEIFIQWPLSLTAYFISGKMTWPCLQIKRSR